MKMNFRTSLLISLLIYSNICIALEVKVKLSCQLEILKIYSTGSREKLNMTALFDVSYWENFLYIASLTDEFASVISKQSGLTQYVLNRSDDNRWDLLNHDIANGNTHITRIIIDRNTGQILYNRNWRDYTIETQGSGFCSKIDTSKRKF